GTQATATADIGQLMFASADAQNGGDASLTFSNSGSFAIDLAANAIATDGYAQAQASIDDGFEFFAYADSPGNASVVIDNAGTLSLSFAALAEGTSGEARASITGTAFQASAVIDVGVGPVLGSALASLDSAGSISVALAADANDSGAT